MWWWTYIFRFTPMRPASWSVLASNISSNFQDGWLPSLGRKEIWWSSHHYLVSSDDRCKEPSIKQWMTCSMKTHLLPSLLPARATIFERPTRPNALFKSHSSWVLKSIQHLLEIQHVDRKSKIAEWEQAIENSKSWKIVHWCGISMERRPAS